MEGIGDTKERGRPGAQSAVRGKPLKEAGIFWPYIVIPTHWITLKPLFFYLKTVVLDFFLLQFRAKWGWRKSMVVQVTDAIDGYIPFRPDLGDTYLDFINFWIRPLNFIILRFGRKRALPHLACFMDAIGTAYSEAARVYKVYMSTTPRPPAGKHRSMRIIHRLDPHFLCVPSLHIAVVVLAHTFFTDVFRQEGMDCAELEWYSKELWEGAVEIGQTVLYVKQHSVNCIPAALYMMTHLLKDQFTIQRATEFIDRLFATATDISVQQVDEIRSHIHYMFDRLVLEGCNEEDWTVPVLRWLASQPGLGAGS